VETFEQLFEHEYPRLAGYCWNLVGDREAAADVAQEAFARLLARWLGVREPRAYLYRIATNLAHDVRRDRARHEVEPPPMTPDPAKGVAVRLAVDALPSRYRAVVWLHYFAGLPVADVALVLGRSAGTVKWRLSEARARLARVLEDGNG
jgi:RNA polymerase sigma-70 factor (ECF subfamily)